MLAFFSVKLSDRCRFVIHVMAEDVVAAYQCQKILPIEHNDIDGGEAPDRGCPGRIFQQGQFSERIAG